MFLTIFTPTYNRDKLLERLFNSLVKQNDYDFEWLIIDDGSSDQTQKVVSEFKNVELFDIRYMYQENAGKHVAFNRAIEEARGDFFLCVDSDDWLNLGAVSELKKEIVTLRNDASGIISLKSLENGSIIGGGFPTNIQYSSLYNLASVYHCGADRTLVYRTTVLKQYRFPVFKEERFMTECVLYDQIDMKYEMKLSDMVTTICEYQPDGLSSNLRKIQINNPQGTALFYRQRIALAEGIKTKCAYAMRADAFEFLSNKNGYDMEMCVLSRIIGWIVSKYYCSRAK